MECYGRNQDRQLRTARPPPHLLWRMEKSRRQALRFPAPWVARVLCVSRSMVHMRTANSVAMQDRGSGMGHQQAYLAAVDGKHRASKAGQTTSAFKVIRGFAIGAGALFAASVFSSAGHAQSASPFNGLAGVWCGVGKVELDDGSSERIRCRATYAVGAGGTGLNQSLTCASDSYKFELKADVVAQGSEFREPGARAAAASAATSRAVAPTAISRSSPVPPASTPTSR